MNEKGIRELLLASINLLSQKFDFELHLLGELTSEVTEFIIKNRVELFNDKIKFISYVNDVSTIIKDSHVIIHPSYHEGMSNALLEAAACGRPLLASNIPGCREIIEHDVNGFLFEPKNIIEIESSMIKILSLSIKDLSNMGLASRKKVELIFDRKSINAEFMNLIEDIETGALK
jgi:galacturonosyltransferase